MRRAFVNAFSILLRLAMMLKYLVSLKGPPKWFSSWHEKQRIVITIKALDFSLIIMNNSCPGSVPVFKSFQMSTRELPFKFIKHKRKCWNSRYEDKWKLNKPSWAYFRNISALGKFSSPYWHADQWSVTWVCQEMVQNVSQHLRKLSRLFMTRCSRDNATWCTCLAATWPVSPWPKMAWRHVVFPPTTRNARRLAARWWGKSAKLNTKPSAFKSSSRYKICHILLKNANNPFITHLFNINWVKRNIIRTWQMTPCKYLPTLIMQNNFWLSHIFARSKFNIQGNI